MDKNLEEHLISFEVDTQRLEIGGMTYTCGGMRYAFDAYKSHILIIQYVAFTWSSRHFVFQHEDINPKKKLFLQDSISPKND